MLLLLFNYFRSRRLLEEGQNAQADLFVFEMVWIELKLSDENSSDEHNV